MSLFIIIILTIIFMFIKENNKKIETYYDEYISGNQINDYEYFRWHASKIKEAGYKMTLESIFKFIDDRSYHALLEIGPGSGVWSKILIKRLKPTSFDLLDLSQVMVDQLKNTLKEHDVNIIKGDVQELSEDNKYDFVFSSRSIEYWDDKRKGMANIFKAMKNGSKGIIITKSPHYFRQRLFRKRINEFHSKQIDYKKMEKLLGEVGFINIKIYPCVLNIPLLSSANLNLFFWRILKNIKLNKLYATITESYIISFEKI